MVALRLFNIYTLTQLVLSRSIDIAVADGGCVAAFQHPDATWVCCHQMRSPRPTKCSLSLSVFVCPFHMTATQCPDGRNCIGNIGSVARVETESLHLSSMNKVLPEIQPSIATTKLGNDSEPIVRTGTFQMDGHCWQLLFCLSHSLVPTPTFLPHHLELSTPCRWGSPPSLLPSTVPGNPSQCCFMKDREKIENRGRRSFWPPH
jgi:hypothetical protein